ncbi:MAG: phage capsid protein [Pseudomonadota bacterium]
MANAPFVTDPIRTAIAIQYTQEAFVADDILPRRPVGAEEFKWTEYNKADRFTVPETLVDRKGELNQVEFGGTEKAGMTNDYGLKDVIPQKDIDAGARANFDVLGNATEGLTDLVLLDREMRVSTIMNSTANYAAGHSETLSAGDRWTATTGNPIVQLSDAMEVPFMRPNVLLLNPAGALALRRNAEVVKAYNGTLGDSGLVPMEWIRQAMELDQIIVGRAKYNTSKKGQPIVIDRLWQNNAIMIYRNPNAMPNRGLTYGLTAQYGTRMAMTKFDDEVGLRGATVMKVGESLDELVLANDCGYLIEGVA